MQNGNPTTSEKLQQLVGNDEAQLLGIYHFTEEQQDALLRWGMRMYDLGRHTVGDIQDIKFEGRLIILDDGSRWAVDSFDSGTAEYWSMLDKVVGIGGVMYSLEGAEQVNVEEEYD
jgi:hypothetical protein